MRLRAALVLMGVALVGMAGCASGGPGGGPGPGAGGSDSLAGRTFLSVGVVGATPVPDTQIRLSFVDGRVMANAGCNSMSGGYALSGDTLMVNDLAVTEMGCDPARHEQDEWVSGLLTGRPQVRVDGDTIVVMGSTIELTMRDREVVQPDQSLVGPRWMVDTLLRGESASSVPAGAEAYLVIEDIGDAFRAMGHTGCNQFGGPVEVGRTELTFGEIVSTKMACTGAADALERAVLAVLNAPTVSYEIEADRLTLLAPDGAGLQLRATA
jgi:heat shock protein HslJ